MSVELGDLYLDGVSDCCSAKVFVTGLCSECLEYCGVVPDPE